MMLRRSLLTLLLASLAGAACAAVFTTPAAAAGNLASLDEVFPWCDGDRLPAPAPDVCSLLRAGR